MPPSTDAQKGSNAYDRKPDLDRRRMHRGSMGRYTIIALPVDSASIARSQSPTQAAQTRRVLNVLQFIAQYHGRHARSILKSRNIVDLISRHQAIRHRDWRKVLAPALVICLDLPVEVGHVLDAVTGNLMKRELRKYRRTQVLRRAASCCCAERCSSNCLKIGAATASARCSSGSNSL